MEKKADIKANLSKIKENIEFIDESKKPIARMLLERAEFMQNTLIDLEKIIKTDGAVIKAINGNGFETTTEHPAQKSYNTMIGRYNAILKTISDMMESKGTENDELMEFLKR